MKTRLLTSYASWASLAKTRIVTCALLICVSASAASSQEKGKVPALGTNLRAYMDKAVMVRLPKGIKTIVVGNPSIAKLTIDKSGLGIVTGRSFGETNVIILDENGDIISETNLVVSDERKSLVTVQSGTSGRVTVACNPRCQPIAVIGDDGQAFSEVASQITQLATSAEQAANVSAGSAPAMAAPVSTSASSSGSMPSPSPVPSSNAPESPLLTKPSPGLRPAAPTAAPAGPTPRPENGPMVKPRNPNHKFPFPQASADIR